ncbi:MAG: hypothetical protein CEE40_11895 [Chloroflexi bacterium B3_Chlor]|nr:MAG: hypothetical protein CEE40_11895 [Chloroflexi bacterium B3_Chlor]
MAVKGDLRDMDLSSIISINCNEMNQARLLIRNEGREATVFFQDGNIVHMSLDSLEGEEVIYELLAWDDGTFELEQGIAAPTRTVTTGWSELVLEGMQQLDEATALDSVARTQWAIRERDSDEEMTPGPGVDATEGGTDKTEAVAEKEVVCQAEAKNAGANGVVRPVAKVGGEGARTAHLQALVRALFRMGVDSGLAPQQAALQASAVRLPAFVTGKDRKEFEKLLVEAYQQSVDERLKRLRHKMGFEEEGTGQRKR